MTATNTRHATTPATASRNWRSSASCQGIDEDAIFSTRPTVQAKVQGICRGCPVRAVCLQNMVRVEGDDYLVWGVAGGLTDMQRRALRTEMLLGNVPNLEQAELLTRPWFAQFMRDWRAWPPETVAAELRKHNMLASPVTVRLALWWTGAHAGLIGPRASEDARSDWMVVRDEHRATVRRLRAMDVPNVDVAAYLGVAKDAVERAVRAWRLAQGREVQAA
ncbi:WhiB family transcriptional regulator [Streptomyces griseofuscus]|uniref:WhiB family transcriptional regulator n=1 Tax=Streptomyces griseofuscus TaxID=146922 RepID=UPI0036862290